MQCLGARQWRYAGRAGTMSCYEVHVQRGMASFGSAMLMQVKAHRCRRHIQALHSMMLTLVSILRSFWKHGCSYHTCRTDFVLI